jgi:hypothetical protein
VTFAEAPDQSRAAPERHAIAGVDVDYPSGTWLDVEAPAIKQALSTAPTGYRA